MHTNDLISEVLAEDEFLTQIATIMHDSKREYKINSDHHSPVPALVQTGLLCSGLLLVAAMGPTVSLL